MNQFEMLTLSQVAAHPDHFAIDIPLPGGETIHFRPLLPDEAARLAEFLEGLSPQTRQFWITGGYDLAAAQEMCKAIARYDKLRFVAVQAGERIIALFEFSFDILPSDQMRFRVYGVELATVKDCRFGPCIADDYQGLGLGIQLFNHMVEIARLFGQRRIILWGGVHAENLRAIKYYEKLGFERVGSFTTGDGIDCYDMMFKL